MRLFLSPLDLNGSSGELEAYVAEAAFRMTLPDKQEDKRQRRRGWRANEPGRTQQLLQETKARESVLPLTITTGDCFPLVLGVLRLTRCGGCCCICCCCCAAYWASSCACDKVADAA